MMKLAVVCWLWGQPGYRTKFLPEHVNILQSMVARNLSIPHKFYCVNSVTNRDILCDTIDLWDEPDVADIPKHRPNCYRRLKTFSGDAKTIFKADWVLSIDLDCVIVDDITSLLDFEVDFKIWGDTAKNTPYNGSFWLLKLGSRTEVWDSFVPEAPMITQARRIVGSDQAWIGHTLGKGEEIWTRQDGLYSYRNDFKYKHNVLPDNAKIVFFHGDRNPWDAKAQRLSPWIKDHWRH